MFLLAGPEGGLIDVDLIWTWLIDLMSDDPDDWGAGLATGVALGLRLAADDPTLGKAVLASYERRAAVEEDAAPETTEVLLRKLVYELIDHARRER